MATGKCAKELIVKIVAVGDDNDCRILHCGMHHNATRIECHRQTLARALRVPDDANASIAPLGFALSFGKVRSAFFTDCGGSRGQDTSAECFKNSDVDSMVLVVARHLLDESAAGHFPARRSPDVPCRDGGGFED